MRDALHEVGYDVGEQAARDRVHDDERGGAVIATDTSRSDDALTTWPNARICAAAQSTDVGTMSSTARRSTPGE